nr:MAG TPA: hypothetical protein [Caudoviricetes sp.]
MNRYIDSPFDNVILPRVFPGLFLPCILFFSSRIIPDPLR